MLKRKIIGAVLILALLLSFAGLTAQAATRVDTDVKGSLQLTYSYDGQLFEDLEIQIYRVAEISEFAEFTLTGAFQSLSVSLENIKTQDEWREIASTLSAYIVSDAIAADYSAVTGADGTVSFTDLPLGLYLVYMVRAEQEDGYCHFDSFMISVPTLDETDNWVYDVIARPKSFHKVIVPKEISYTVNKLWRDEGHEHLRPQNVSIDLYRDGEFVETVVLSAENNWTYTWTTTDDGAIWQAVETNVPEGYTVTLEQSGNYFFVTNSYDKPTPPPSTGDISNPYLYLIVMCVAGLGLIVLGITGRRGKKA